MIDASKPRIALFCNATMDTNGGVAGATHALAKEFRERHISVSENYFPMEFGSAKKQAKNLFRSFRVAQYYKKNRPDILDITSGDGWLAADQKDKSCLFVARSHGLEHTVHASFMESVRRGQDTVSRKYHLYHGGYRLWEVGQTMRNCDCVFLLNQHDRSFAVSELGVAPEAAYVVDNGINSGFLVSRDKIVPWHPEDELRVAIIGSFIKRKGIDYSIPAINEVCSIDSRVRFSLLGTSVAAGEILKLVKPSIRTRVSITPRYQNNDLPELLAGHHILLFCSLAEGFPLAPLEAMARGLAPIVTDIPGIAERLQNDLDCLKIPVRDSESAIKSILSLAAAPAKLEKIRVLANQTAQTYTWDKVATRQLAIYRESMARKMVSK